MDNIHRLVMTAAMCATAVSQESCQSGGSSDSRKTENEERSQDGRLVRSSPLEPRQALFLWRLTTALELDQNAAPEVFRTVARFDRLLAEADMERAVLLDRLESEVKKVKPDEGALLACIDGLLANHFRRRELEHQRVASLRTPLNLVQQGKLLLLLPRLDRELPSLRSIP
jgi:hypothetical protein